MQYFKGDETEIKFENVGASVFSDLEMQRDSFFDEAFECFILGEILFDSNRAPLANAIERAIFRSSFFTIFDSFLIAGSLESYLTVFRKIFGDSVEVTFTVPTPGNLQILIEAQEIELENFIARRIENNSYIFDEMIDDEDDNIVFQSIKGFESEYELEQMLYEMVPSGIYTEITLTLG